jgi:hypothetical protein
MLIITVTTNTASGGDFVSLTASSCPDGWFFEISDSCGLEFVLPADTLKEMPNEDSLMKFIDAIRLEGEPEFRGLVFGFLEANYPSNMALTELERKEAESFIEVESKDFPRLEKKYKRRLADWMSARA